MFNRPRRPLDAKGRRRWPTSWIAAAGVALFVALGGTAVAANSLIHARDIAAGAVTSKAIRDGGITPKDLSTGTRALLNGGGGLIGPKGDTGSPGAAGANGANGPNGADGVNGTNGLNGTNGINGTAGADGTDGTNGLNGTAGADGGSGADGVDGVDGTDGTNGADGTITPLFAEQGFTALPTASPPVTVVSLAVPAGAYVVLAKTQLTHSGAGDSIDCSLKADFTTLDQIAMKTLPALAAIPASMQAVTTVPSPSTLKVECTVAVANGSADFSSLIAMPTA
jgi:hypothetical protein